MRPRAAGPGRRVANRRSAAGKAVLALAALLAALALVAWRQSTARETMAELDEVVRQLALAADERQELDRRVASVEKRSWVEAEVGRRLGLRPPRDGEVVIPSGGSR